MSMLTYAKVKAVAVSEDARGRGIGAALLKRCVQLYGQLDYTLLFGEIDTGRDLRPYYTRQGFTVLRPGQARRRRDPAHWRSAPSRGGTGSDVLLPVACTRQVTVWPGIRERTEHGTGRSGWPGDPQYQNRPRAGSCVSKARGRWRPP